MDPNIQQKRRSHAQCGTTIESLSDDVLADILVRLPSPASLGCAALSCSRWRRLATSRDFLRRFRALHPSPPLLGCFFSFAGRLPIFHRVPEYSDRSLAAAVRGGDFLLTSFVDAYKWAFVDCHDGVLLLSRGHPKDELALFDPVSHRCVRIPFTRNKESSVLLGPAVCLLPSCGGDIVSLEYKNENESKAGRMRRSLRVRANVYCSRTGEWRSHQWAPPSLGDHNYDRFSSCPAMHAARRIYWKCDCQYLRPNCKVLSLNTETMEFSYIALPPVPDFSRAKRSYVVGDTEDGACCLVSAPTHHHHHHDTLPLRVWLWNEENGSWELWWELQASALLGRCGCASPRRYQVAAVIAGVVLLQLCGHDGSHYIVLRIKNKPVHGASITRDDFEVLQLACKQLGDGPKEIPKDN